MLGTVKTGHFLPTKEELGLVAQIYRRAHCSRPGYIEVETLAEILSAEAVDLPPVILNAIWDLVDESKSGYLSETGVIISLRLIGWAQSGEEVTADLVKKSGPLPRIKGLRETDTGPLVWPPFTESTRDASQKLFEKYGPVYGLLEGDKARDAFLVFDLKPKDIWKIWEIVDTQKRGALDKHDFALAIYLIQCVQSGQLPTIPPTTPPQIYKQIYSSPPVSPKLPPPSPQVLNTPVRPRKPTRPPPPPIIASKKPTRPPPPPIITSVASKKSPRSAPVAAYANTWAVSPSAKATAEQKFDELDTFKVGYIEGDVVAKFMREFELIPEELALIWDLADLDNDLRLTRDEFVIAMHLIEQRMTGVELPHVLPTSLLPPSLRGQTSNTPHLQRSATSPSRPKKSPSVLIGRDGKTNGSPPLPPKPPNHHRSVSAVKDKPISPGLFALRNNRPHSITIPAGGTEIVDAEPPSVVRSKLEIQTVSLGQYQALEQQHVSLSSRVEELSSRIIAQQDPFVEGERVSLEQYRTLEEENYHLSANINVLTAKINALYGIQGQNETLSRDKARLHMKIQEMEQITSDLLQSNEAASQRLEVGNAELERRFSELEQLRPQLDHTSRRLDNTLKENKDLSQRLREARESADTDSLRAAMEIEDVRKEMEVLEEVNEGLRKRAESLQRIISETSTSDMNPEMEILMGDLTRENENLKQRLRQMENSTANLLLSTNGHAELENQQRENQRLKAKILDLEQLIAQLQKSSEEIELKRVLNDVTMENEQLKCNLREIELEATQLRQTARRVEPLEAEIEHLRVEIRRLHAENLRAQVRAEESSIPPPAYDDDSFR